MPPLRHTVGGQFDYATSEVVTWLVNQPTIRDYLFRAISRNGLIVYDTAAGTWQGRDYKAPPPIVF